MCVSRPQGELPKIKPRPPVVAPSPVITSVSNEDWSIKPNERAKYDQIFDSLQPANGYIPGNKVKGVLMNSKLPVDTLGVIWDLADMDKDGMLDRHEFVVVSSHESVQHTFLILSPSAII